MDANATLLPGSMPDRETLNLDNLVRELAHRVRELNHRLHTFADRLENEVPSRAEFEALRRKVFCDVASRASLEEIRAELLLDNRLREWEPGRKAWPSPSKRGFEDNTEWKDRKLIEPYVEELLPAFCGGMDLWVSETGLAAIHAAFADVERQTSRLIADFKHSYACAGREPSAAEYQRLCTQGNGMLPSVGTLGPLGRNPEHGIYPIRLICSTPAWRLINTAYYELTQLSELPWHIKTAYRVAPAGRNAAYYRLLFCIGLPSDAGQESCSLISSVGRLTDDGIGLAVHTVLSPPGAGEGLAHISLGTYKSDEGFLVCRFEPVPDWPTALSGCAFPSLYAAGGCTNEADGGVGHLDTWVIETRFCYGNY